MWRWQITSQFKGGSYGSSIPVKPVYVQSQFLSINNNKCAKSDWEEYVLIDCTHLWSFLHVQACKGLWDPLLHKSLVENPRKPERIVCLIMQWLTEHGLFC